MGRKVKCQYCGKEIEKSEAYCAKKVSLNGEKNRNKYFCNNLEFYKKIEEDIREKSLWEKVYDLVKYDILHYDENQVSNLWITMIQDLRNGTTIRTHGRDIKSKCGYPYEVIYETFIQKKEAIEYSFRTKNFKNESAKIKYMMAIIRNSIDDFYNRWKREQEFKKNEQAIDENLQYSNIYKADEQESSAQPTVKGNKKQDLFGFLEDI